MPENHGFKSSSSVEEVGKAGVGKAGVGKEEALNVREFERIQLPTSLRADSLLRNSLAPTLPRGLHDSHDTRSVAWVLGTPSEDHAKILLLKKRF